MLKNWSPAAENQSARVLKDSMTFVPSLSPRILTLCFKKSLSFTHGYMLSDISGPVGAWGSTVSRKSECGLWSLAKHLMVYSDICVHTASLYPSN